MSQGSMRVTPGRQIPASMAELLCKRGWNRVPLSSVNGPRMADVVFDILLLPSAYSFTTHQRAAKVS